MKPADNENDSTLQAKYFMCQQNYWAL